MSTKCPELKTLRLFEAGTLGMEEEALVAAHIDQCQLCQNMLEKIGTHSLAIQGVAVAEESLESESVVLAAKLSELKVETSVEQEAARRSQTMDLKPWLEKSTDESGRQRVHEFELRECIGRGGMGIVFRAFDTKLKRMVALKFMSPHLLASENATERFFREAQAAAAINHANVVAVYSVNLFEELPYLVMELVAGETLAQLVEMGRMPLEQAVFIGKQVAQGLAAAHAVGVQHRDIKPTNILLDGGQAKLSDFGLARVAASEDKTGTGTLVGTPEFIAPERIEPRLGTSDHRSDLFSLGAVLYVMASGKSPFTGQSVLGTLKSICVSEPDSLSSIVPNIPAWMDTLVSQLLAKRPDDRIQQASDVVQCLEQQTLVEELVSRDLPKAGWDMVSEASHLRRLWQVLVGFGCVLLTVGGLWAIYGGPRGDSKQQQADSGGAADVHDAVDRESGEDEHGEYISVENGEELTMLLRDNSAGDLAISLAGEEFRLPPIEILQRDLTLVAASGFRPVLFLATNSDGNGFTATEAELDLRGITIESDFDADDELEELEALLHIDECRFRIQDCSIKHHASNPCMILAETSAVISGCNVLAPNATAILWQPSEEHQLEMTDNILISAIQLDLFEPFGKRIRLRENTFLGRNCFECGNEDGEHSLYIETEANTFVSSNALFVLDDNATDAADGFHWLHWQSIDDVLPIPLMRQVIDSADDEERKRVWALMDSLKDFENVNLDESRQETEFMGSSLDELETQILDGELTPATIRQMHH